MIAAEREASHAKRRRKDDQGRRFLSPASPVASSLENSSDDHGAPDKPDGPADETDGEVSEGSRKPAHADTAKSSAEAKTAADAKDETFASPAHKSGPPSQPPCGPPSHSSRSSKSGRKHSTASYKAEQECAQLEMQCILGTLEPGFRKQKPIFPQSVLGHLFLRKFGLNREQRSQVIRSTGGSSRFLREEAHMTEPTVNTQFQYMVSSINVAHAEDEVFLASIPVGMAILDTGCIQHHSCGVRDCPSIYWPFSSMWLPSTCSHRAASCRTEVSMVTVTTTSGLCWTVKLGDLHGTITTYVIEGVALFLISRRVLEGMGAVFWTWGPWQSPAKSTTCSTRACPKHPMDICCCRCAPCPKSWTLHSVRLRTNPTSPIRTPTCGLQMQHVPRVSQRTLLPSLLNPRSLLPLPSSRIIPK